MLKGMIKVLSQGDMEKLHNAALTVLQNTGLKIQGKFLLDALRDHGCKVDDKEMRAWFDPALVEKQIPEQALKLNITEDEVVRNVMLKNTIDGQFTSLDDVARTVLFAADDISGSFSGQSFLVTHGWCMK